MAENEAKPEKKQVEMSIWCVILLVVVIVFMCVFLTMNKKLGDAQTKVVELESKVASLEKTNSDRAALARDLAVKATDGDLSMKQLLSQLEAMGFDINSLPSPSESAEPASGEVISGEIAE